MPQSKREHKLHQYIELGVKVARETQEKLHYANSALGILNASPKTSNNFPDLLMKKSLLWRFVYSFCTAIATILRSVAYWPNRFDRKPFSTHCDILFISHLTNISQLSDTSDFYFGDTDQVCRQNGFKTHTILINHCKAKRKDLNGSKKKSTSVLLPYLSPFEEINIFFKLFMALFSLPKVENSRFMNCVRFSQFDHKAIGNARINKQVQAVLLELKPKLLIQTFEGHGWERMNALFAHSQLSRIKVIGYHHAVLFPGPRTMDFIHGNGSDPDKILMAGLTTKTLFLSESQYNSEDVSVLGSVKNVLGEGDLTTEVKESICLIVPEGDMDEVKIMVKAGIEAAKKLPEVKFLLRLHPLIDEKKIIRFVPSLKDPPVNFLMSTNSLKNDIGSASWLLYRASSVVFYGMANGLRPIYIDLDESAYFNDPVPNSILYKKVVSSVSELVELIKHDISSNLTNLDRDLEKAITFANEYYTTLTPTVIMNLINGSDFGK